MIYTFGIALSAFVSTNIDDLFLLGGFFSDKSYHPRQVILGQYLGIIFLIVVSGMCALLSIALAPAYIGLLGILPIGIGLKKLWEADAKDETEKIEKAKASKVFAVAGVVMSNGGDNVGIYTPLFAASSVAQFSGIVLVFLCMTGVWCFVGHWLVHHKRFGTTIAYWGHRVLPFVLIALGVYIFLKDGTLTLLGHI